MTRHRRGRTAPFNGSVTREDLRAIHREFTQGIAELYTPAQLEALEEHLVYLVGAIEDRPIGRLERHRRSIAMTNVHARRRGESERSVLSPRQRIEVQGF